MTRVKSWTCVVVATTLSALPPEAPADGPSLLDGPPQPASKAATKAAPSTMRSLRTPTPWPRTSDQNDNRSQGQGESSRSTLGAQVLTSAALANADIAETRSGAAATPPPPRRRPLRGRARPHLTGFGPVPRFEGELGRSQ